MSNIEVVHIPHNSRYEIHVDGKVAGFTEAKERADGVVLFPHTVVDDEYEGRGWPRSWSPVRSTTFARITAASR